ncbi:MAG: hypothetical protein HKO08_03670 [Erythrobacter sp.]|nr:hypothetical protein [Erythrobacter sp.]
MQLVQKLRGKLRQPPTQNSPAVPAPRRFFQMRGGLDLSRDTSSHRRYAWLYEDVLQ